jgi:acid phosphatase (class A)
MTRILTLLCFVATLTVIQAQQKTQSPAGQLTPARGHYKQLQAFSAKPQSTDLEVDKQKFPYDAEAAARRLSLKPYYLSDRTEFKIPDPPANSSEQTRAELNYLLGLQQRRTPDEERSALHKAGIYYNPRLSPADSSYSRYRNNLFYIGRSIGTWFNPENLPVTADFMARVWQDASYFIWSSKYKYLRVRPYVLDSALHNLEETNWAAYPSGHAANSYINAYIYQELAPEFSDVFIKDALDMAHSREIIGVHYPSDSEASRVFARQFVSKLFQNEKFLKDFEVVKAEWDAKAKESFTRPHVVVSPQKREGSSCAKTCN